MNIKILVILHKQFWVAKDEIYFPLQVGAQGKKDLGYHKDNIGDNISYKNPNFCELTGLYWAWKNLKCDYIGLCHYRRYFAKSNFSLTMSGKKKSILKKIDYEKLLQQCDVILPEPFIFKNMTVKEQFDSFHNINDLETAIDIIHKKYPSYDNSINAVLNRNKLYGLNMFVMRKSLLDEYCEWLFPILFELEERVDITGYSSYQTRLFGFISERLFDIWLEKQKLRIKEVPVMFLEKSSFRQILGHYYHKFWK